MDLLGCASFVLSSSQSDECFGIRISILIGKNKIGDNEEWANWAKAKLVSERPSVAQHELAIRLYRQYGHPAKSRLYEVLSAWAKKDGLPRPD